jgi:hypothetical protein
MALTGHDEAPDPVAAIHLLESGDRSLKPTGNRLRFESECLGQTLEKQVFAKRNDLERASPTQFGYRPPAPDRIDFGLESSSKRRIAPEDELNPPREHRIPEDGRLKHHIVAFKVGKKIWHFHVQQAALFQDTQAFR